MEDHQSNIDTPAANSRHTDQDIPINTKCLAEAIVELNISRKNVLIYPPEHVQVKVSTERACKTLCKAIEDRPEITLGVAKNTLLLSQERFDEQNPVYKELAMSLSQHDVAAVTFCQGLHREELFRFLGLLARKPEEVKDSGGIEKAILDSNTPHVRVQAIDYGRLHLTEEEEIFRPQADEEKASHNEIWGDFITHLMSGTLLTSEQGMPINDPTQIDPVELAHFINEHNLDGKAVIQSYEKIISDHLQETSKSKRPPQRSSASFEELNTLLEELRPELKRQFLSATFRHCSSQSTSVQTGEFLNSLTDDLVIEMLDQANREGREISPGLLRLVQKISNTKDWAPLNLPDRKTDPSMTEPPPAISLKDLKNLFCRESHEEYVESDYDEMLEQLAKAPEIKLPEDGDAFPTDKLMETLDDSHLDLHIARVLISLVDQNIDEDEYRDFSRELVATLDALLEKGEFGFLLELFGTLTRHSAEKPHPKVRYLAKKSLQKFSEPDFVSNAVAAFDTWAKRRDQEASDFLFALGLKVIPGLLDLYTEKEHDNEDVLANLLCRFGQAASVEVKKEFQDLRPHAVKKLVMLIRRMGDQQDMSFLRPLLKHQDEDITMEVLATLLELGDPWAVVHLRKALGSRNPHVSAQAVSLAGRYRVADVAQDLVSMIKCKVLSKSYYQMNEKIIEALGQIADPCAIPTLKELAQTKMTLYPKSLSRMKVVLFESLDRYPHGQLTALLHIGSQSSDERVRQACRKLMERD